MTKEQHRRRARQQVIEAWLFARGQDPGLSEDASIEEIRARAEDLQADIDEAQEHLSDARVSMSEYADIESRPRSE